MPLSLDNLTLQDYGAVGNSVGPGTIVASINNPGKGRYRIWGHGRHPLADGFLCLVGVTGIEFAAAPNDTVLFGPIVLDVLGTENIFILLNTGTGPTDTAACTVYALKLTG